MAYANFNDAAKAAIRMSNTHNDDYWVVFEDNAYHVASDYDLETWFAGCTTLGYAGYGLGFEAL